MAWEMPFNTGYDVEDGDSEGIYDSEDGGGFKELRDGSGFEGSGMDEDEINYRGPDDDNERTSKPINYLPDGLSQEASSQPPNKRKKDDSGSRRSGHDERNLAALRDILVQRLKFSNMLLVTKPEYNSGRDGNDSHVQCNTLRQN
ncbi:hypothetical protein Agabi119p4_10391 [Agaricus bisporus var. burnettii]|uniref:Uncharacterized protein n=1 Tax=Agaricus bisporus var. burnettii TaxID=192524 RepID=A0A8H7C1Y4_AGABI|nr:hypothetical protein Agabi119p4_10391 [Agaricus bisporus var. burnettii]